MPSASAGSPGMLFLTEIGGLFGLGTFFTLRRWTVFVSASPSLDTLAAAFISTFQFLVRVFRLSAAICGCIQTGYEYVDHRVPSHRDSNIFGVWII